MKLSQKRAKLTKRIDTYSKRRIAYRKSIANLNKKVKYYKEEVRRIDKKTTKIKTLVEGVKTFNELRGIKGYTRYDPTLKLARGMFYKYGIENGIRGSDLRDYIGSGDNTPGYTYRKWLTKEIVKSADTRQKWENFKRYMENKLLILHYE